VPSNHSAPLNPQAIAEVKRILKLHLRAGSDRRPKQLTHKRETAQLVTGNGN
jgi:hypothetical protein